MDINYYNFITDDNMLDNGCKMVEGSDNMSDIVSLISNVGFPMAMTLVMMWYIYDSNSKHAEQIKEINAEHKKEMDNAVAVIERNSEAIEKLADRIERM